MTDPRIEAAARELKRLFSESEQANDAMWLSCAKCILDAADAAAWRPIVTAPRDGTQIVLFRPKTYISDQRITAGAWYEPGPVLTHIIADICEDDMPEPHWKTWDGGFLTNNPQPTHWQPLPAPPTNIAALGGVDG